MREASYYTAHQDLMVKCDLCPNRCNIDQGNRGNCEVRINKSGKLFSENYGEISAIHSDPIEKKPLYHFYPGTNILSIGSLGCNMHCGFCQNSEISQISRDKYKWTRSHTPNDIIETARSIENNLGIAFTYNEPTVFYEFMWDTAILAKKNGLKTVMISNGYISEKALMPLLEYMDAFNIDLKFFSNRLYKKYCYGKLNPILRTIIKIYESGKHLELTNLVIPTLNDNILVYSKMIEWIYTNLGDNAVLHLSKYVPAFRFNIPATRQDSLTNMYRKAKKWLPYTYLGNIHTESGADTFCKSCNSRVVQRHGYDVLVTGLDNRGRCKKCNQEILKYC